jgi:hypothetical protein
MDIKMLNITGLSEIIDILKFREKYLIKLKHTDNGENFNSWREGVNINDLNDIMEQELGFPKLPLRE